MYVTGETGQSIPTVNVGMPRAGVRQMLSCDPLEHALLLSNWTHKYRQLSQGKFIGQIEQITVGKIEIIRERLNCTAEQCGAIDPDYISFITFAPDKDDCIIDGIKLESSLAFIAGLHEINAVSRGSTDVLAINIPRPLADILIGEDLSNHLYFLRSRKRIIRPPLRRLRRLRSNCHSLLRPIAADKPFQDFSLAQSRLHADILSDLQAILTGLPDYHAHLPSSSTRAYVFEHAREIMRDNLSAYLNVDMVARESRVSRRTLQYCFEEALSMSPSKYLLALKLDAVRRDLLHQSTGEPLHEIAIRWGFPHPGRFASYYSRFFGELPSTTRRSARRSE